MDVKKKILLVEDPPFQRTICVSQLKQAGFENIEVAGDGNATYSKLLEDHYDLVICDWEMPELNGIQLLKKVKKIPLFRKFRLSCAPLFGMKSVARKPSMKALWTTSSNLPIQICLKKS